MEVLLLRGGWGLSEMIYSENFPELDWSEFPDTLLWSGVPYKYFSLAQIHNMLKTKNLQKPHKLNVFTEQDCCCLFNPHLEHYQQITTKMSFIYTANNNKIYGYLNNSLLKGNKKPLIKMDFHRTHNSGTYSWGSFYFLDDTLFVLGFPSAKLDIIKGQTRTSIDLPIHHNPFQCLFFIRSIKALPNGYEITLWEQASMSYSRPKRISHPIGYSSIYNDHKLAITLIWDSQSGKLIEVSRNTLSEQQIMDWLIPQKGWFEYDELSTEEIAELKDLHVSGFYNGMVKFDSTHSGWSAFTILDSPDVTKAIKQLKNAREKLENLNPQKIRQDALIIRNLDKL